MKVIFTGGGTAGHAMVNTVLISRLIESDTEIIYIGSKIGIEKEMIKKYKSVKYCSISTGKLRRYFSIKNITDIFRIIYGFLTALKLLYTEKPNLIYSSGGYVSVPVVWAGFLLRIPIVIRETDYTVGLANKLSLPFADKIYLTFPDTQQYITTRHNLTQSTIIRPELFETETIVFSKKKPLCLVMGGSSGANAINNFIWDNLTNLKDQYDIIHITGKNKSNKNVANTNDYIQYEYIEDMSSMYNIADVIITRSGSNAIIEGLLLGKRMVCIPLSNSISRGEQIANANFAVSHGTAIILPDNFSLTNFREAINSVINMSINTEYISTKGELEREISEHISDINQISKIKIKKETNYMNKKIASIATLFIVMGFGAHIYRLRLPEMIDESGMIISDNLGWIVIGILLILIGSLMLISNILYHQIAIKQKKGSNL